MRRLALSDRARADLERIREFNETRTLVWADKVEARLRERARSLCAHPYQGRPISGGLRRLSLPDVQYVMIYALTTDEVVINEIWSTREGGTPQ